MGFFITNFDRNNNLNHFTNCIILSKTQNSPIPEKIYILLLYLLSGEHLQRPGIIKNLHLVSFPNRLNIPRSHIIGLVIHQHNTVRLFKIAVDNSLQKKCLTVTGLIFHIPVQLMARYLNIKRHLTVYAF